MDNQFFINQVKKKIWAFPGLIFLGGIGVWAEGSQEEIIFALGMAALPTILWLLLIKFSDKATHKEFITALACIFGGIAFQMSLQYAFKIPRKEAINLWLSCISLGLMVLITYARIKMSVSKLWNIDTLIFDEYANWKEGIAAVISQGFLGMICVLAIRFTGALEVDIKEVIGFYAVLFSAISFFSLGIWHLGLFITTVKLNRQHNVNFRDKYLLLLREQNNNSVNQ